MIDVFQYILTSAQSFGSQDYYNKTLMAILGLAGVLFCKISRHRQNGLLSFVLKKILTWLPKEATGDVKAITGKRLQVYYHFFHTLFVTFCFFQPECCFPARLSSKPFQHIG